MTNRRKPIARRSVRAVNTGEALELEVFATLKEMLASRRLGLDPNATVVRLHPSYHSQPRGKAINFDVSIELTIPGASAPTLLWIWECKDYSSAIPAKVVSDFHGTLEEIGADGTKGTIITRGTYQTSAIKLAEARKMGLARLLPGAQVDWVVHRTLRGGLRPSVIPETYEALTLPHFTAENQNLYGFTANGRTMAGLSLESFVRLSVEEWGLSTNELRN
jgi:hypothetical protein